MPPGIHLQLTMTLGDIIVAATTVIAIVSAYYAVKRNLETILKDHEELKKSVAKCADEVGEHGEQIASLNTKVFGRRRGERNFNEG